MSFLLQATKDTDTNHTESFALCVISYHPMTLLFFFFGGGGGLRQHDGKLLSCSF